MSQLQRDDAGEETAQALAAALASEQAARAEAVARAAVRDAVFEAMPDAVVVYDPSGGIIFANAAFRSLMAVDLQPGFLELPLAERMARSAMRDEQGRLLTPDEWPMLRIARGEILTGSHDMDFVIDTLDGRERQLNVSGSPARDQHGSIVAMVIIYRDVTERRHLERRTFEALRALLEMAEVLVQDVDTGAVEDSDDPLAGVDIIGDRLARLIRNILGCQRVSITMLDAETRESRPIALIGAAPEQARAWRSGQPGAALRDYLTADEHARLWRDDMLIVQHDGAPTRALPFDIRSLLLAVLRVGHHVVGVLSLDHGSVAHTYTPDEIDLARAVARLTALVLERGRLLREQAVAQASALALREANRRMDAFLVLASHELRTPLTILKGNIQIAQRHLARAPDTGVAPSTLALLLSRADKSVTKMDRLIGDLLDMTRAHSDRLHLDLYPCDLLELLRETIDECRLLEPERALDFSTTHPGSIMVCADAQRIGQVMLNYLSNALRYAPPDRPIATGVRVEGTWAVVWVRDEGPGIEAADRARIWDRFYRVAHPVPHVGATDGLGVGLFISKTIIERHGGEVGVESALGAGATFWFTLPLLPAGLTSCP